MSRHGQVILERMAELIDEYRAGRVSLRRLVDDLRSMYESLEPSEQPPEREWLDGFVPLDRLLTDRSPQDHEARHKEVDRNLAHLRDLITRYHTAA